MAYARPEKARAYRDHLAAVVLPGLRRLPGFLGLELCEVARGDQVELPRRQPLAVHGGRQGLRGGQP